MIQREPQTSVTQTRTSAMSTYGVVEVGDDKLGSRREAASERVPSQS